jgi:hypothetical protein
MVLLVRICDGLAMDEEFKEEEHPRDKDGKFAKEAGGGASTTPEAKEPSKELRVAAPLKAVFSKNGFKKVKQSSPDKVMYYHPASSLQVVIHRNPKAARSDLFSSHVMGEKPAEKASSKGAQALAKLIAEHLGQGEAAKPAATPQEPQPKPGLEGMIDLGKFDTPKEAAKAIAALDPNAHPDDATEEDEEEEEDFDEVAEAKAKLDKMSDVEKGNLLEFNTPIMTSIAKSYGFQKADTQPTDPGVMLFAKPGTDKKLLLNAITEEWISESPGNQSKEGKGFKNLEKLLSGKPKGNEFPQPWIMATKTIHEATGGTAPSSFSSSSTAHITLTKSLEAVAPEATATEAKAINGYSGSAYSSLNAHLRDEIGYSNPMSKALDSFLANATIDQDCTLWRNISGEFAKHLKSITYTGHTFTERAFCSTSTWKGASIGSGGGWPIKIKINVKKGQQGASIYKYSNHKQEYEVLLPRNLIFQVKAYDRKAGTMEVDIVGSHEEKH